jgi:hypothetical protein
LLPLDDPYWSDLRHAYGSASDIPPLLAQLRHFPGESSSRDEPWLSLWSALYHQEDIFEASFAAVPHIVDSLAVDPARASLSYFLLPASIEIARASGELQPSGQLVQPYHEALGRIPALVAASSRPGWDSTLCTAALAAVAAATGNHQTAGLLLSVDESEIIEVLAWLQSR